MNVPVDPKVLLGALLVALVAASRFNTAPPARETVPDGTGGPTLIAFVVALLFPVCPPFRAGERAVRRTFYDRASIPAQQLRERHRLKHAPYVVHPLILQTVQDHLAQEDFEPADLGWRRRPRHARCGPRPRS